MTVKQFRVKQTHLEVLNGASVVFTPFVRSLIPRSVTPVVRGIRS